MAQCLKRGKHQRPNQGMKIPNNTKLTKCYAIIPVGRVRIVTPRSLDILHSENGILYPHWINNNNLKQQVCQDIYNNKRINHEYLQKTPNIYVRNQMMELKSVNGLWVTGWYSVYFCFYFHRKWGYVLYNNVTSVCILIGCWPWSIKEHTHRWRQIHVRSRQQTCFSFFIPQKSFNKPFEFLLYKTNR